jgi:hypothetical protein
MTPPSKWLFFPAPAATGPLQTITWNMTGASNATVSSSGAEIINPSQTSLLSWADGLPRLWNGSAAEDAANFDVLSGGRYNFTSGTTCRDWWCLYGVTATLNGGSSHSFNATFTGDSGAGRSVLGAVAGSCQTSYINIQGNFAIKGSAFVSGDVLVFTVTAV